MRTKNMVLVALFAALTAIGAFIRVPIAFIPFTLQFLFCAYAGVLLGAKLGAYSQLLYIVVGLTGIPIFATGGGPEYIVQPTFGYLIGFVAAAWVIGRLTAHVKQLTFARVFFAVIAGVVCLYCIGVAYMYLILNLYLGKSVTIWWAIYNGAIIFSVKEIALAVIIALSAVKITPIIRKMDHRN